MNQIQTKLLSASSSNLADMLTMVNPIDLRGHSSKGKVTMGGINKCWVRGDATLWVVIFCMVIGKLGYVSCLFRLENAFYELAQGYLYDYKLTRLYFLSFQARECVLRASPGLLPWL